MHDDLKDMKIDVTVNGVDPKLTDDFVNALKQVDGAEDYLRASMEADVKAYFNAQSPLEQAMIKGAYFRMKFILKKMQDGVKPTKKLKMGRYVKQ